jgi:adenosine kinase
MIGGGYTGLTIVVTGSVAFDYIMSFPGHFKDHIIPEKIDILSVSFLVDSMKRQRGGCATNIAYNLALLGERPRIMATVGQDFSDYRQWLEARGVDTSGIVVIEDDFTASFFVSTDLRGSQIASFYTGAMSKAGRLSFRDAGAGDIQLAIVSPNDPAAMTAYARECASMGIPFIYDPSQQIIRLPAEELVEGTRAAAMLIVNDYEYEMIKNKTGLNDLELESLAGLLIVTRGENGSVIVTPERRYEIPAVLPRKLADPTGVGDAYRAGVIKGMTRGASWQTTGRMAALAATYALEENGTQNHLYSCSEFLTRYRDTFGESDEVQRILSALRTAA